MGWPTQATIVALLLTGYSHYCLTQRSCEDGLETLESIPYPEDCNAVCEAKGEPHFNSFDCVKFDFHGKCDYTLVKNCGGDIGNFEIVGEFFRVPLGPMSVIKKLRIIIGGTTVELDKDFGVTIDGNPMSGFSVVIPFTIQRYCNAVVVYLNNGITIYWSSPFRALIVIEPEWREALSGNVCGLCGNFNGLKFDDFTTRENVLAFDVVEFADSWRIEVDCPLCNDCDNDVCKVNPENREHAEEVCQIIKENIILPGCGQERVNAFFTQCFNILCASLPEYNGVCQLVKLYINMCDEANDFLFDLDFMREFCEKDPECTRHNHPKYGTSGQCVERSECPGGKYISGLCPDYSGDIKCCFTVGSDEQCAAHNHPDHGQVGYCIDQAQCPDNNFVNNLCPSQPADIKCCFSRPQAPGIDPCKGHNHPDYGFSGNCVAIADCPGGKFIAGLCPNDPNDVKCCFTVGSDEECATHVHPDHGEVGYCIHKDQCPNNSFVDNLCPDQPSDTKCCFSKP